MKIARRAGVVLGSISAAIATLAAGMPARAASTPDWQIVAKVHYGTAGNASGYSAIIAPARNDAWAFGGTNPGGPSSPTAERWNGRRWESWPLPAGLDGFIAAAADSSPSNVWAVADGYALRWNGVRWAVAKTWSTGGEITSVAVISRRNVWVFGSSGFTGEPGLGTWHYDGRSWTRLGLAAGPGTSVFRASAVSQGDIWGITAGPRGGSVVHYNGTSWSEVPAADAVLAGTQLDDILAVSWHDVWVSGTTPVDAADGRLVLAHWNGRCWRRFPSPWRVQQPERFATDGAGGIWIPAVTGGDSPATWILHLSPDGAWTRVKIADGRGVGVGVGDLALVPGTSTLWGTGGLVTTAGGDAAIWDHGVLIEHLAVRVRRAVRAHLAIGGREVIQVWMAGRGRPAVHFYLTTRRSPPGPALAGRRPRLALAARD
jgi:hypothetical protein